MRKVEARIKGEGKEGRKGSEREAKGGMRRMG